LLITACSNRPPLCPPHDYATTRQVDKAAVAPHVPALLRALITCFKDTSWPVRDAACVACGRWVADE